MLVSRGEAHLLAASEVGLPLVGPNTASRADSAPVSPFTLQPHDDGSCSASKVTFLSLGAFSANNLSSPARKASSNGESPASSCHGQHQQQPTMSRFMSLARKFNCFYFNGDLQRCRPFLVAGKQVGVMLPKVMEAALRHPDVFVIDPSSRSVSLHPSLYTYEERSAKVNSVLSQWREEGLFLTLKGWRNECYEVRTGFADQPLLRMERSATCLFGIRQYGVDINGYTRHPHLGVCLWLQRRSFTKPTWPGKWDNMVAGGVSVGHSPLATALKEADEEASIHPRLLASLKSAGSVSFYFESERGLFPNTQFVYDLELPGDFVPRNADGEVESFELVPVGEVMERLLSPEFKTTSCPTTLDFLIRHGHINADNEPNLPQLVELLHIPLHYLYSQS